MRRLLGLALASSIFLLMTVIVLAQGEITGAVVNTATNNVLANVTVVVHDAAGNVVTDAGPFIAATVPILTAAQQAVSVDKTKPGFIWRVFQNGTVRPSSPRLSLATLWYC